VRCVLGGKKPPDLPSWIGESGLDGVKTIKQDALVIGYAPGPVSLPVAPVMALRPVSPWSIAPHGPVVSFAV
jgi:hypothetical protein